MRAPLASFCQSFSDIYDQRSGYDVTMTNFETWNTWDTLIGLIYEQFLKKLFFSTFGGLYHFLEFVKWARGRGGVHLATWVQRDGRTHLTTTSIIIIISSSSRSIWPSPLVTWTGPLDYFRKKSKTISQEITFPVSQTQPTSMVKIWNIHGRGKRADVIFTSTNYMLVNIFS